MEVELHEGLFMNEGHFIEFRLGDDNMVWVEESIPSQLSHPADPGIINHVFRLSDALDFQKHLLHIGYIFLPVSRLSELIYWNGSRTIH